MIDETGTAETGTADAAGSSEDRAGFCQDCGRPLTRETARPVGQSVFCEPCLAARLSAGATAAAAGAAYGVGTASAPPGATGSYPPPVAPLPPIPTVPGDPSPVLAGILGLIPGVGPMYNGQFSKGIVYFLIFVVLIALANDVNGIFALFIAAWILFGAFEAYHTARARVEGLPLPNAFGFNDIGDRMGFGKNWPGSATRTQQTPMPPPVVPVTPWTPQAAPSASVPPNPAAPPTPPPLPPMPPTPNWVGYVPPTEFGGNAAYAAATASRLREQAYRDAGVGHPPYAETYTGADAASFGAGAPPAARRFPAGALWLIGLGVLFLLSNVDSRFDIRGPWLVAAVLAVLAVWSFLRRLEWIGRADGMREHNARTLCVVRWPAMLMLLAVLFALQAAGVWPLNKTWPALLLGYGALLLLERTAGRPSAALPMTPTTGSFVPPAPQTPPSEARTASARPEATAWSGQDDAANGGER